MAGSDKVGKSKADSMLEVVNPVTNTPVDLKVDPNSKATATKTEPHVPPKDDAASKVAPKLGLEGAVSLSKLADLNAAIGTGKSSILKMTDGLKKASISSPAPTLPEDPLNLDDVTEVVMVEDAHYVSEVDKVTDHLLKSTRTEAAMSKGVPEMIFMIQCLNPAHTITERLDKGLFAISGSTLAGMSVKQLMDWMDDKGSKMIGCGHDDCDISLSESMYYHLEDEEVECYSCKDGTSVNLSKACPHHANTKLEYLALSGLATVAQWYKMKARFRQTQNVTLPHTTLPKAPGHQIFPLCSIVALSLSSFVKAKANKLLRRPPPHPQQGLCCANSIGLAPGL